MIKVRLLLGASVVLSHGSAEEGDVRPQDPELVLKGTFKNGSASLRKNALKSIVPAC